MKIRITILAILLILLIIVPIAQTPKTMRNLRIEFEKAAKMSFGENSLEDFVFLLIDETPGSLVMIWGDQFFKEKLPTWRELILNLYDDPKLAEFEPYIYASKILQKNLKSHDKRRLLASLYLSYCKPDTLEARIIEEYSKETSDKDIAVALFIISKKIEENFYDMQYGLMKYTGLRILLPRLYFFERPPEAEIYYSIYLKDTLLSYKDCLIKPKYFSKLLDYDLSLEKHYHFCILVNADYRITWQQTWEVLDPLMKLSERSTENIEFFFVGKEKHHYPSREDPAKLGIKFKKGNKPLKNIDMDIRISEKEGVSVNGEKKKISDLENLPPNKNIKFTFERSSPISYFLTILSLIKKSNPSDYYYVVE